MKHPTGAIGVAFDNLRRQLPRAARVHLDIIEKGYMDAIEIGHVWAGLTGRRVKDEESEPDPTV